ncbi:MAG: EAL domain-containing protein, partial [Betaproteobacteria bacterium]
MNAMTAPTVRVLLTEDVAADAELEVRELKRAGLLVVHRIVASEQDFERALREFSPDVILSDFSMPGFDGMAALAIARERAPDTPFIFVSGTIGEEYAIRALKNGATDYVLKTNLVRLPAAVERALAEAADRRESRRTEAELEIARERLTSIFTSLPDVLWSVDARSGQLIYASPATAEVFGHPPDAFLRTPSLWMDLIHPDDRAAVLALWRRAHHGEPFEAEYRTVRPDGTVRWINARGRLVRAADGTPDRLDGLARDVTKQQQQKARIARLQRIRDIAGEVNAAIVRIRDRQELFEAFCRIAIERAGFQAVRLTFREREDVPLRVAVAIGDTADGFQGLLEAINRDPQHAPGLLAEAMRSARVVVSNDASQDERAALRDWYASQGANSIACLPFQVEGRVAGAIILTSKERGFFDEEEVRLLMELAGNLSFALELIEKQDRIAYLALYDSLTGLPNRTLFGERLTQAIEGAKAADSGLAVMLVDLERFKAINDTVGTASGDQVLKGVAARLRDAAGDLNRVARIGGNQFALLLPRISGTQDIARGIEHADVLSDPFRVDDREIRLSGKTGIAVYPEDGADADMLFRNAEAALKRAKETGERYLFYAPEINARVSEQVEIENRLRKAVDQGELFLHYQPKLELATRRVVGLEALLRWTGPDGKLVPPVKFVPVLEQTGLILEAGRQAIARASRAFQDWSARGVAAPRIAVNVSALQLRRRSFVDDVRGALVPGAQDGGGVDLEITESLLMTEVDDSIRKLRALRELGLRISLDDFGTGYSSLAYLSRLPVDTLKIDRAFVHGMTANADDTSIVSAIISLAQALRLKVVAEGVETEEQAQLLRLLRCDQVQGYLFSPPLPPERLEPLLKAL